MSSSEETTKSKTAKDFKTAEKSSDQGYCFPISSTGKNEKRCTVSKFKGKVLVDIREYYQADDGEMKPGRKGISLAAKDWKTLTSYSSLITEAIEALEGD